MIDYQEAEKIREIRRKRKVRKHAWKRAKYCAAVFLITALFLAGTVMSNKSDQVAQLARAAYQVAGR